MNPETINTEENTAKPASHELESIFDSNVLPSHERIREIYELEMSAQDTPPIRAAQPGETANVYITLRDNQTPEEVLADTEMIRNEYIRRGVPIEWWRSLLDSIQHHSENPDDIKELRLAAKHTADIVFDGERQDDQSFDVYEIGDKTADNQSLQTIFSTLRMIDQFSGGLLAADPRRPKIILGNNVSFQKNHGGDELKGFAMPGCVFINMKAVAESAKQAKADPQEILAVVLTHELLGHGLERVLNNYDRYFKHHFDYSDEMVGGELFEKVHKSITPKDSSIEHSHPVREYGSLNVAEDFATSVDATVAEAMGFDQSTNKIPTLKSKPDEYRKQLAMEFMDKAAQRASQYMNTPGFVGSEIRYAEDEDGKLDVKPARDIEITSMSGLEATQSEITKIIDKCKFPDELIVAADYDRGI